MNEWVIVAIVAVVVLFGINKLPEIARNMGKAQGEFKKGLREGVTEGGAPAPAQPNPTAPPAAAAPTQPTGSEQPKPVDQPPAEG